MAWASEDTIETAKAMPTTAHLGLYENCTPSFKTRRSSRFLCIAAKRTLDEVAEGSWMFSELLTPASLGFALNHGNSLSKDT